VKGHHSRLYPIHYFHPQQLLNHYSTTQISLSQATMSIPEEQARKHKPLCRGKDCTDSELQWAQVIEKTGGPVKYKKIPVQKPGPDEVLVNIKYSGVCHTDLHAVNGDWPLDTKLPLVGGHEGAGVVVARGELVKDIEIGDHAGVKVGIRNMPSLHIRVGTDASRSGSIAPASLVTSANNPTNPSAPRLLSLATLLTEPSNNTALPMPPMLPASPRTSHSMLLRLSSAPVSLSTRVSRSRAPSQARQSPLSEPEEGLGHWHASMPRRWV
jgi:hypothetical protein